jgi:integrase/recombinase XerD
MSASFDLPAEQKFIAQYVAYLPPTRAGREGDQLLSICEEFRQIHPGETVLAHAHTTEWLRPWLARIGSQLRPVVRTARIGALGRWWTWLFQQGVLDDNVLACFFPYSRAIEEKEPLILWQNLQRPIADYLEERGPRQPDTRRKRRRLLGNFNVFLHRSAASHDGGTLIDEERAIGWLRHLSKTRCLHSLAMAAQTTERFLRFLVDKDRIQENALRNLRRRYIAHRWEGFLSGLLGLGNAELVPSSPQPYFVSPLGRHLQAFIDLKRAMGRRYEGPAEDLQRFDRFVAGFSGQRDTISRELIAAWLKTQCHVKLRTRRSHFRLVRRFCLYLARLDPKAYVPDPCLVKGQIPQYTPHIYTIEEFRGILKAALALPARPGSMRPKAIYTALLILYGTGLRSGEALHLRLRDVDMEAGTLLIRETKFFKSRVVPMSASLRDAVREYLEDRLRASTSPEAFLFLNDRGGCYSVDKFAEILHGLLVEAQVKWAPGQCRPRVHDIRHTFAANCVLRWYREGADLQAKLPLLATYMGHVSVLSTQDYLKATPELLREASARFERSCGAVIPSTKGVTR